MGFTIEICTKILQTPQRTKGNLKLKVGKYNKSIGNKRVSLNIQICLFKTASFERQLFEKQNALHKMDIN